MNKHIPYLKDIKMCSKLTQEHGALLSKCQGLLDDLVMVCTSGKGRTASRYQHCELSGEKISPFKYDSDKDFVLCVIKLQNKMPDAALTTPEEAACGCLLKNEDDLLEPVEEEMEEAETVI